MFVNQTKHPNEQDLWDYRCRLLAWTSLIIVAVLGGLILWTATWTIITNIIPWLATYLNDEYMDLAIKDTARLGLSRLIFIASMSLFIFDKINFAFNLAYQSLGERPSNRSRKEQEDSFKSLESSI